MKTGDLRDLVALLRELGVTRYRSEGVELDLGPNTAPQVAAATTPEADIKALEGGMPSDEDMLAWSTSGPLPSEIKYPPPEE